mgnify:CR=1 FL=1
MTIESTVVCIIGKPCSGKSTVSKKLLELGWNVINVGEKLRSSNNLDIQRDLRNGNYIDPNTIMSIIGHDLQNKMVILDGYPRDLKQLEYLKRAVSRNTIFIEFLCSDTVCLQRAAKRCRSDDSMIQQRLEKHALESKFLQYMDTIKVDVDAKTDNDVYEAVRLIIETIYIYE